MAQDDRPKSVSQPPAQQGQRLSVAHPVASDPVRGETGTTGPETNMCQDGAARHRSSPQMGTLYAAVAAACALVGGISTVWVAETQAGSRRKAAVVADIRLQVGGVKDALVRGAIGDAEQHVAGLKAMLDANKDAIPRDGFLWMDIDDAFAQVSQATAASRVRTEIAAFEAHGRRLRAAEAPTPTLEWHKSFNAAQGAVGRMEEPLGAVNVADRAVLEPLVADARLVLLKFQQRNPWISRESPTPASLYAWCQARWDKAEKAGNPILEDGDAMYRLAAKHFGITGAEARGLYLQGGWDAAMGAQSNPSASGGSVANKAADSGDAIDAWVMTKQFVLERLKAPSSASWPWFDSSFVSDLGGGRFRVVAYVDAVNSFGAKLRSHFVAVVARNGRDWTLESCDFTGR